MAAGADLHTLHADALAGLAPARARRALPADPDTAAEDKHLVPVEVGSAPAPPEVDRPGGDRPWLDPEPTTPPASHATPGPPSRARPGRPAQQCHQDEEAGGEDRDGGEGVSCRDGEDERDAPGRRDDGGGPARLRRPPKP